MILLLIALVAVAIGSGSGLFQVLQLLGVPGRALSGLFSTIYGILIMGPIGYGVAYASLKAARDETPEVSDVVVAFQCYVNAVLAHLLVTVIVIVGFALFIVPGIFLWCRLVFTPYLIVDRKMDAIEAIQESWRLTSGHTWTVFLMSLLAIPISFAGLVCCGVGIIFSSMLISVAFASLYDAISLYDEPRDTVDWSAA